MHPLVQVAGARGVIAALRRSPPWATIEADFFTVDHACGEVAMTEKRWNSEIGVD
jgi:arginine/ornithine N-succinyltransferase beta subunit